MSFMFEVYYEAPPDAAREERLTNEVARFGGCLDFRELPDKHCPSVVLTYEFQDLESAEVAASHIQQLGEYVEGPVLYGDD